MIQSDNIGKLMHKKGADGKAAMENALNTSKQRRKLWSRMGAHSLTSTFDRDDVEDDLLRGKPELPEVVGEASHTPPYAPFDSEPYQPQTPPFPPSGSGQFQPRSPDYPPSGSGQFQPRSPDYPPSEAGQFQPRSPDYPPSEAGVYQPQTPPLPPIDAGRYEPHSPDYLPSDYAEYQAPDNRYDLQPTRTARVLPPAPVAQFQNVSPASPSLNLDGPSPLQERYQQTSSQSGGAGNEKIEESILFTIKDDIEPETESTQSSELKPIVVDDKNIEN